MNEFKINISDEILDDLKYRLERVRWPDEKHCLLYTSDAADE